MNESLGISGRGGKTKCLKRIWDHLQAQELIAAHGAQQQLRGDLARPVHSQFVPAEPTEKEVADHNLSHQPFAAWCELCIANRSQQDGHPAQRDEPAGAHTCVSFDFGFASRTEHEPKACGLFIHDRHSGAMHVVPTPQKGGRHLQYLCTEFCRFLVWLGQSTIGFDATRSHQHFLCLKLLRKHADHLESESLKRQFLQEVMLRMVLQKSL